MTPQPLPPPEIHRRRSFVLVVSSATAILAGFAIGYALGTVHAYERRLTRRGHHGV